METKIKDLIGKKITGISMNQEYLRFDTDDGSFTYTVEGDCCSSSFFFDFYGVRNVLENGKVKEVKQVDLHPADVLVSNTSGSCTDDTKVYGYQIFTESKDGYGDVTAVFSFRNVSNGYYGGSIDKCENKDGLPEITEDVIEIK